MLEYIKVVNMQDILKKIEDYALEEIMGERLLLMQKKLFKIEPYQMYGMG